MKVNINRRDFVVGAMAATGSQLMGCRLSGNGISTGRNGKGPVRFLYMTDIHIESDFVETRGKGKTVPVYTMWKPGDHAALIETYRFINTAPECRDLDFALFGGDQLNTGYSRCPKELADEKRIYDRTLETLDLHSKTIGDTDDLDFVATPWTVRENLTRGMKAYEYVPRMPVSRTIAIQGNHDTGVDDFYRDCAFTVGDVRMIAFFASYVGLPPPPGKLFHSTAKISDATVDFIAREMKNAAADPKFRHIVLTSHWALAEPGKDFVHPIIGPCKANGMNDNRRRVLELAEKYGCDLFINGHEHNCNYPVGRAGAMADINCGTVTASPDKGAFAIVEIGETKATFEIYSRAAVDADGKLVRAPHRVLTREIPLTPIVH